MDEEICTFSATPCNGTVPQLFRAVYQFTPAGNGCIRKALVPGTLEQLTAFTVLDSPEAVPVEMVAEAAAAQS
ncbi:MAG: hypothetical protein HY340_04015 [Candidatus Kerfeldbacteria bacterium]|nr:hypothetical protein [Candidatus Kerfeldbacteria bacterium]